MGGFCGRRAAHPFAPVADPPAPEPPAPEPEPPAPRLGRAFHDRAVQALRKRFGLAWTECGQRKLARAQRPLRHPETRWRWIVEHKLFQRHYHNMSELLKEIKRNGFAKRSQTQQPPSRFV